MDLINKMTYLFVLMIQFGHQIDLFLTLNTLHYTDLSTRIKNIRFGAFMVIDMHQHFVFKLNINSESQSLVELWLESCIMFDI